MLNPTPESNIWTSDADTAIARIEEDLYLAGSSTLYHIHKGMIDLLHLNDLTDEQLSYTYRVLAKAPKAAQNRALNRAYNIFTSLTGKGKLRSLREAYKAINALIETWYGKGALESRAQAAAVKSVMIGKVRAGFGIKPDIKNVKEINDVYGNTNDNAFFYGREHASNMVTKLKESTRNKMREITLDAHTGVHPSELENRLMENFAVLNKDMRSISITEAAMNRNHGFLAGALGKTVEWSAAIDACPHCMRHHEKKFKVVRPEGNWDTEVWIGKTNFGRSASPTRRDGSVREDHELWKPTIPQHPHCRCRWILALEKMPIDPKLDEYLNHIASL